MKVELFNELVASLREGGKILRGKAKPSRKFIIEVPDVKKIRSNHKPSQKKLGTRKTDPRRTSLYRVNK